MIIGVSLPNAERNLLCTDANIVASLTSPQRIVHNYILHKRVPVVLEHYKGIPVCQTRLKIYRILSLSSVCSYLFKTVTSHQNVNDFLYALRACCSLYQSPHPPQYIKANSTR